MKAPDFNSLPAEVRAALLRPADDPGSAAPTACPTPGAPHGALSETERAARYVTKVPAAKEGQRNQTLYALAFKLGELFRLSPDEILDACRAWNARCTPPVEEREITSTVRSAIRRAGSEGKLASKWQPPQPKAGARKSRNIDPEGAGHEGEVVATEVRGLGSLDALEDNLRKLEELQGSEREKAGENLLKSVLPELAHASVLTQERVKGRLASALGMSKPALARVLKQARRRAKGETGEMEGHPDYQELARRFLRENSLGAPDSEVRLRYYRQEFFLYNGQHWEPQGDDDFAARLTSFLQRFPDTAARVSRNLVTNVLQNLKGLCCLKSIPVPFWVETGLRAPRLVSMRNGLVDLDALVEGRPDMLKPHTPRFFNVASLPYPYDPDANCPRFKAYLARVQPDSEVQRLLIEWLGYNLIYDTRLQRFMLLQGEGSNGKSVYSAVLKAIVGRGNYSAVSLSAFTAERSFCLVPTIGKLANIQTDLDFVAPKEEGRLKAFVSGEELEVERKNKDAVTERPTARLTFACNPPPMFRDRSRGVWRRLLYVRFREQIPDSEANPDMTEEEWWEAQGELPGIFNLAVGGLKALLCRGHFEEPATCRIDKEEYRQELNPADIFLRDHCQACPCAEQGAPCGDVKHAVWTGDLYEEYRNWLRNAGHDNKDALSKAYFGREVRRVFPAIGLTSNAKMHRVYRKQLVAGVIMTTDEVEKEVRDRAWEGLVFHAHGIPNVQNDEDDCSANKGVGA